MSASLSKILFGFVALFVLSSGAVSTTAQPAPAVVDSIGRALADGHPGGVVIGFLHGDETSVQPFGAVDSTGTSLTARTVFEIGSITKTFTGLLLAEQVERGRMHLSDPVAAFLPDSLAMPARDSSITLAHLATHRSGLPRLPSNLGDSASPWDPYATYGDSALYAFLDTHQLARAPGTSYEYSNLGMGLLGHVLARQADTTYAALVRRRIAEPLGLSDTRIHLSATQKDRFAQGHNRAGAPAASWHFEALAGAGALRSTAADLLTYLRAHRKAADETSTEASTLDRAMRRALAPRAATSSDSTRIGLAWHVTTRDDRRIAWHNGGTGGFRSFAGLDRATGLGVVLLTNTALASDVVTEAGFRLIEAAGTEVSAASE